MTMDPGRAPSPLRALALAILALFSAAACSSEQENTTGAGSDPLALNLVQLYSTVFSMTVDVAYEPDAVPYTGSIRDDTPYWWILQNNMEALFLGRDMSLSVPWTLDDMVLLDEQGQDAWTTDEIIDLARSLWVVPMTAEDVYIHVLFLSGYFEDNGTVNRKVLGVSFGGSCVIAIFKDAILDSGSTLSISRFVEQATLVHETGHLLGLVDNGIPMVSDHADPDHPRHCENPDCVMYWLNEGADDLKDFVRRFVDTGSLVLFGDECLMDVWNYDPLTESGD